MGLISKKAKTSAGRPWGVNVIYGAQDGQKDTPYMLRAWVGRLRFHLFMRGDQDPDCHDHPWGFWTFPLRSYVEEVAEPRVETYWGTDEVTMEPFKRERRYWIKTTQIVQSFRLHYRPATHTHRVIGPWSGKWLIDIEPRTEFGDDWILSEPQTKPGWIPTIVWTEKVSRKWGFLKDRNGRWCWVGWKDYVFNGGKTAPCQDESE